MLPLLLLMMLSPTPEAYYVSGVNERAYADSERVDIRVNSLRSLSAVVPYDYYSLPFCRPAKLDAKSENIGELIWGDKIQASVYSPAMRQNVSCARVRCDADNAKAVRQDIDKFEKLINLGYRGGMSISGLPMYYAGTVYPAPNVDCVGKVPADQMAPNLRGYALGVHKDCRGEALLNNHIHFRIEYNEIEPGKYIVVGFTGTPISVRHNADGGDCTTTFHYADKKNVPLSVASVRRGTDVVWSYSVSWVRNQNVRWATRWDAYLMTSAADSDARSHWVFIAVALVMTLCLCTTAVAILMRTLHKDFNRYNSRDPDDTQEEVGWKLVHADVFRTPAHCRLLSSLAGTGVQLILMMVGILVLANLGFTSPASRGQLLSATLLLYITCSYVSGYCCGLLLRMFELREWRPVFVCALLFSGSLVTVYVVVDVIDASLGASNAASAATLAKIFFLWLVVSLPLCVLGASTAFRQEAITHPVAVSRLAREIPEQRYWIRLPWVYLVTPMFPLCTLLLELDFILRAVWGGAVYYVFGFLSIVYVLWAVVAALTAIITVYFMLAYENHQWWWAAFIAPGGVGVHLWLYFAHYYATNLSLSSGTATVIYFLSMSAVCGAYALMAGSVGLLSSLLFVRKIFSAIKVD